MNLIPDSISAPNTEALDATFADRLTNLGTRQLLIDLATERDPIKLTLYLQQFGIPIELLPSDLSDFEFRRLLQHILRIYRLSGTTESIVSLALALGASTAGVKRNAFVLNHTRQARHDGLFRHNQGREYRSFSVDVCISGVADHKAFETSYRKLFQLFQPVSIHLRHLIFE